MRCKGTALVASCALLVVLALPVPGWILSPVDERQQTAISPTCSDGRDELKADPVAFVGPRRICWAGPARCNTKSPNALRVGLRNWVSPDIR